MLHIGIVAGETSGDIIAADFIQAVKQRHPDVEFEGVAGPLMREAGCKALFTTEQMSVMGFVEVIKRLPELLKLRKQLVKHFSENPPDVFIGVDAPDFNLTLERKLKERGITTVHYVSPSAWAWRTYRVKKISRSFDLMLSLLPFEADFYNKHGVDARFVGHPMADQIPFENDKAEAVKKLALVESKQTVALLPGSRSSEVNHILPLLLSASQYAANQNKELQFVIPAATQKLKKRIQEVIEENAQGLSITLLDGQARDAMLASDLVMLCSGTATLEAMLLKRPMIITFLTSRLSYWIFKSLTVVKHIGLPNFFDDTHPVPEFIQDEATAENVGEAMLDYLNNEDKRIAMCENFQRYHESLKMNATQRAAQTVLELIEEKNASPIRA